MKMKIIIYALIHILMFGLSVNSGLAVNTCFNTSENITICQNTDSGMYPQNIALWEGENEKYGIYLINPDDDLNNNIFVRQVKSAIGTGKIDVTKLGDESTLEFQNINDFYNLAQQQNAIGNVTLFTQAELNQETRERNVLLTTEVIGATVILLVIVMELLKIFLSLTTLVLAIYLLLRVIPFGLKHVVRIIFKISIGEMPFKFKKEKKQRTITVKVTEK